MRLGEPSFWDFWLPCVRQARRRRRQSWAPPPGAACGVPGCSGPTSCGRFDLDPFTPTASRRPASIHRATWRSSSSSFDVETILSVTTTSYAAGNFDPTLGLFERGGDIVSFRIRQTGASSVSPGSSTSTSLPTFDDHIDVTLGPGSYIMALAVGDLASRCCRHFRVKRGGCDFNGAGRVLLLGERHAGRRQHRTGPRARDRHPGGRWRPRRVAAAAACKKSQTVRAGFELGSRGRAERRLPRKFMLHPFRPSARRRIAPALALVTLAAVGATLSAQQQVVPGTNVNMVSGTTFPDGDPYLQRQNEPSSAVSTRNPLHILGGANDYRTVDLPGPFDPLRGFKMNADAWMGLFKSTGWRPDLEEHAGARLSAGHFAGGSGVADQRASSVDRSGDARRHQRSVLLRGRRVRSRRRQAELDLHGPLRGPEQSRSRRSLRLRRYAHRRRRRRWTLPRQARGRHRHPTVSRDLHDHQPAVERHDPRRRPCLPATCTWRTRRSPGTAPTNSR